MTNRMAIYLQAKEDMQHEIEMVRYMEERGFTEVWNSDTSLARDCIVMMSAFLATTRRIRVGSGVLPIWTRNAAVIAASWSTMWELGGRYDGRGRVMLGLGAWWEPIATHVGVKRVKPLRAMREHIEALRQLFTMEEVTYHGEFVHLENMRLDIQCGDPSPRDIPLYIGATGDAMLELSGEICDGVVLNYGMSVERIKEAIALVEKGAKKAGKTLKDVDLPELLVVSLSDRNPDLAVARGKVLVTSYLAIEPHFRAHLGAPQELIDEVCAQLTWPNFTPADIERVAPIIPEELVRKVAAVGSAAECRAKVKEYVDAGVTCPILYPLMGNIKEVVDAFAGGL